MRAWRISNHADLSGIGGKYKDGRWNKLGRLIVYCADHPALAMLEILVHMDPADLPEAYQLLEIDIPENSMVTEGDLPESWRGSADVSRKVFEDFCSQAPSPVLRVPSIIMPHCFNLLINPAHPQAGEITILSAQMHPLEPRFLA